MKGSVTALSGHAEVKSRGDVTNMPQTAILAGSGMTVRTEASRHWLGSLGRTSSPSMLWRRLKSPDLTPQD